MTKKFGNFINFMNRIVGWRPTSSFDTMVREFAEVFPGKCIICAYHSYQLRESLTNKSLPPPHFCIEKQPENKKKER